MALRKRQKPLASASISATPEKIAPLVLHLRGERVLLDYDLAQLYGVPTKALNQAVKRNLDRFPVDFMFQLNKKEWEPLRSQFVTASNEAARTMKRRTLPYVFTEQGVAMLSSVLRSPRAVAVNVAIMRTFVQLRRLMDSNHELALKIESLERDYDERFRVVFEAIKRLIAQDKSRRSKGRREIGFHFRK